MNKRNHNVMLEKFYPETRFGGFTRWDGTIEFYTRIHALISPSDVVVDIGCGRGAAATDPVPLRRTLRDLRPKCRHVIGLDPDPDAAENPFIHEFHQMDSQRWPLDDSSADLAICDWVIEHVEDIPTFMAQCRRILKPRGYLCIRTANAHGYVVCLSRLLPPAIRSKILARVQHAREQRDIFPAVYRCNTKGKLRRTLSTHGFNACVYGYEAEPSYCSFSWWAYGLGVIHQKLAPEHCKLALFAFAQKVQGTENSD